MTTIRITDYNGINMEVDINETPMEFNRRIDEAWNTRKYSIPVGTGFDRVDVRNIASITEVESNLSPVEPETPEEEPIESEQPEESLEEEAPEEQTEPTEPEPSEDK